LRTANLIFAEHKELTTIVPLLRQENTNLRVINQTWERTDSIRRYQIQRQNQIISQQELDLNRMEKSLNQALIIGGSVTGAVVILTIVCLCLN
jgi:hypothetical protein